MSAVYNENTRSTAGQNAVIAVLLILVAVCGILLYRSNHPAAVYTPEKPPAAVTEASVTAAVAETGTLTATQTTKAAAESEPDADADYLHFLTDKLIPEYGLADDSAAVGCTEQTGIAGAYLADLRGTGEEDLLVIRLEQIDADHAAAPVFEWYTMQDGSAVLLDSFSCKMPWSEIAVRYNQQTLYVSACDRALPDTPESRKYAELTIGMQDADLQTANMEQEYGEANRPAAQYPEDAVLLLTVESDRTQTPAHTADRRYLLSDYTGLRELLPETV